MAYICVLSVTLHLKDSGSLKDKRGQLTSIKKQLTNRFGAAVSEVDHHGLWQRSELLAALVSASAGEVQQRADALERYLVGRLVDDVKVEQLLMSLDDIR